MSSRPLSSIFPYPEPPCRSGRADTAKDKVSFPVRQWAHQPGGVSAKVKTWVPSTATTATFPHQSALFGGQTSQAPPGHSGSKPQTTIIKTTTTTQTVGGSRYFAPPIHRDRWSSVPQTPVPVSKSDESLGADSGRSLHLERDSGSEVWDTLGTDPSLEIISDYEQEELDYVEAPRPMPTTLPPIPSLPPPDAHARMFNPRKPRDLDELDARGRRNVSNSSAESNDPLDPQSYTGAGAAPVFLRPAERKISSGVSSNKVRSSHQKTQSQAHLLPLHLNQSPHLTLDKPVVDARYSTTPLSLDKVKAHWLLLCFCIAFPPMWLVLASGAFDQILHVPTTPEHNTGAILTTAEREELKQISMVKTLAAILGFIFMTLCLAGLITGLTFS